MSERKIDWPRRWGVTWVIVGAVALVADLALAEFWHPGFDAAGIPLLLVAIGALYRASFWRGYRVGRDYTAKVATALEPLSAASRGAEKP